MSDVRRSAREAAAVNRCSRAIWKNSVSSFAVRGWLDEQIKLAVRRARSAAHPALTFGCLLTLYCPGRPAAFIVLRCRGCWCCLVIRSLSMIVRVRSATSSASRGRCSPRPSSRVWPRPSAFMRDAWRLPGAVARLRDLRAVRRPGGNHVVPGVVVSRASPPVRGDRKDVEPAVALVSKASRAAVVVPGRIPVEAAART